MVKRIIELSAKNKGFVILFYLILCWLAIWVVKHQGVDALPDLSDTQVIIYSRWDQAPDIIEDQVTYPIISGLLGAPRVKAIRGFSDYGFSYVYVVFEDGTDIYWARSRVQEYLGKVISKLPKEVQMELGPDATGVGWVYQYALRDPSGKTSLAELRKIQDWTFKLSLQSLPGVSEVATVGGFVNQYQITIDREMLTARGVSPLAVAKAIKEGNSEAGASLMEFGGREYMLRVHGYARSLTDFEQISLGTDGRGAPIRVKDVGRVEFGPASRRGVGDLNGEGDAVSGIVVMRHGGNAESTIAAVKERLAELKRTLPNGVEVTAVYDRSELIHEAISTLTSELMVGMAVVSLVILTFLWHVPSAVVPIVTIPITVLLTFLPMYLLGITSNIMSLAGIAISIGVLVDGAIVEVENAYKRLELWIEGGRKGDFHVVRLAALTEVGPSVFFSLLVIGVAFLPIFTLVDQEGRLFHPLAYTKNIAMFVAAILAITLDPALRMMFSRMEPFSFKPAWVARLTTKLCVGTYYPEEQHPVSRLLFKLYERPARFVLNHPIKTVAVSLLLVAGTIPVYFKLGREFMPPLNEGVVLYMPTTLPGISIGAASELLQLQDRLIKSIPEVATVYGKAGRAETATDPAPLSMMETVVVFKPRTEWRKRERWYSNWAPHGLKSSLLSHLWAENLSWEELITELDRALQIPGTTNAWTMPIKGRIDMLSTGIRTPVGIKVFGENLEEIERLAVEIEGALTELPETRSVFAERVGGGYFVDFDLKREAIARYGLSVREVQELLSTAVGGETLTTTVEGRARFPVNLRFQREARDDLTDLENILIPIGDGGHVPLAQLASIVVRTGPSMVRDENGKLAGYVYVDLASDDLGGYVLKAKELVGDRVKLPVGYSLVWSGQYEHMERVAIRLKIVVPLTLALIITLIYFNTGSLVKTGIVLTAVPFSLIGAVWLMYLLDYNISIAAWVGMIALMGLDAETGVFMLLFLDLSYEQAKREGRLNSYSELVEAIIHGAVKRVRPKAMTVSAAFLGLMPVMWSTGAGADMMKRVAAPMVGGLASSFLLELLVYPALYLIWKRRAV